MEILAIGIVGVLMLIVIVVAGIGLAFAQYVWWAWWVYPAWAWFLVPLGLPAINLWYFLGLVFILHGKPAKMEIADPEKKAKWTDWFGYALGSLVGPIFVYWTLYWLHVHATR